VLSTRYQYYICDVFTDQRFAGNPLAVLPDAEGLTDLQMQQIAREFNFSESTFVLPPEIGKTRRVRIFTPVTELPFAGHPNIGTGFVLASTGELGALEEPLSIVFEEGAGLVPIDIEVANGVPTRCELSAPEALTLTGDVDLQAVADVLSLTPDDIVTDHHAPCGASVGLTFVFAELSGLDALARVRLDKSATGAFEEFGDDLALFAYVRGDGDNELRARMLVASGPYEDPATGSANCALAAMLTQLDPMQDGEMKWHITQGVEMGRPSSLYARAEKKGGKVVVAKIAGETVLVADGMIEVD